FYPKLCANPFISPNPFLAHSSLDVCETPLSAQIDIKPSFPSTLALNPHSTMVKRKIVDKETKGKEIARTSSPKVTKKPRTGGTRRVPIEVPTEMDPSQPQ
ncbi:hypothetical protein U1Q18_050772, partial [Sarracenia purpurea var. burkii]